MHMQDVKISGRTGFIIVFLLLSSYGVCAAESGDLLGGSGYAYLVQEDPYFTFGYPAGMTLQVTAEDGRNTYHLQTKKDPPVTFVVTSMENPEWLVLPTETLLNYEESARMKFIVNESHNLTWGKDQYSQDENRSTCFRSYLDEDMGELVFSSIMSTQDDVIYALLREPVGLYQTEYGNFTLKSLLSVRPRDPHQSYNFTPVDLDADPSVFLNAINSSSGTKDFAYDPYTGLYRDTDTGYYYIPNLGVFFDPTTNKFYYPSEFGNYSENFFQNYEGQYIPSGTLGGYYDGLYAGYDASDIIHDTYQNRQNVYDAANAMWRDYIRDNQYYGVDDSGYAEPIDTVQEYQDYGLS